MPKIIGDYTVVKFGHKVKVESDVKPAFKGAKTVPYYFAIQVKNEFGENRCALFTQAEFDSAEIVDGTPAAPKIEFGQFTEGYQLIYYFVKLYDEVTKKEVVYKFFKNAVIRAFERSRKYPHLCTKLGFFDKLFS